MHDFMDKDLGKAIPYGIYDVAANAGWVFVGTNHDTAAFAPASGITSRPAAAVNVLAPGTYRRSS
jgi:hypothetical protein